MSAAVSSPPSATALAKLYGVSNFSAVINAPQAAILAVGATEDRAVVRDGDLEILPMVTLTGTFDHRAVDGADATRFAVAVKSRLESWSTEAYA